jgi:hypothetical protein
VSDNSNFEQMQAQKRIQELQAVNDAEMAGRRGTYFIPQNQAERNAQFRGESYRTSLETAFRASAPSGAGAGYGGRTRSPGGRTKLKLVALGVVILAFVGWGALADADVLYNNLTGSAATQFNRDFASNTAVIGEARHITAEDQLGLSFAFTMEYTTRPLADPNSAGRYCSYAQITGVGFSRLMMTARPDHMRLCRHPPPR